MQSLTVFYRVRPMLHEMKENLYYERTSSIRQVYTEKKKRNPKFY